MRTVSVGCHLPLPVTVKEEPEACVLLIEERDSSPLSAAQISHRTGRDSTLAHVSEYLMRAWPDGNIDMKMAPYHCRRDELSVQNRCVVWGARAPHCRQGVLEELHFDIQESAE